MVNERIPSSGAPIPLEPLGTSARRTGGTGNAGKAGGAGPSSAAAHAASPQPGLRRRPIDGALSRLQPRPGPKTVGVVLGRTQIDATQAHGLPGPNVPRHVPNTAATVPAFSQSLSEAALAQPFPDANPGGRGPGADDAASGSLMADAEGVKGALRPLFGHAPSGEVEHFLTTLLPADIDDTTAIRHRAVLGAALLNACAQDPTRARRVLDVFDACGRPAGPGDEGLQRDAFATQRSLAITGIGIDILLAQRKTPGPTAEPQHGDHASHADIRHQAEMAAMECANHLLAEWPDGVRPPTSLEELMHVCNHMTGTFPNADLPGELHADFHLPVSHADDASLLDNTDDTRLIPDFANSKLGNQGIAIRGLLAACRLRTDPGFSLQHHAALQLPYLAARNHIFDQRSLNAVGDRFFKLLTYADRAASAAPPSWSTLIGGDKNPLGGVPRGAAGQMMREPEEDFVKLQQAFGPLIERLDAVVAAEGQGRARPSADAITAGLRSATLSEWIEHIGQSGWQDTMHMGIPSKNRILQRAGAALGMRPALLESRLAAAVGQRIDLSAETFRDWAGHARMGGDFDAHLGHVDHMRNRGDTLAHVTSADDYLFGVRDAISGTRMTYGVRFNETRQRGINANVSAIANETNSPNLKLPAAVPVVAAGPVVRLVRTTGATVNAGSSALAGGLEITSSRGVSGSAGISAIASWTLLKALGPSISASLLPIIVDVSRSSGAAVRSRIHHGTDLEKWRTELLSAFDAMYGTDASTRTVTRPADAQALLLNLAKEHGADPYISFGPFVGGTMTIAHSASLNASLRGKDRKSDSTSKGGGGISLSANATSFSRRRMRDTAGVIRTDVGNRNVNGNLTAAANVGVSLPTALTKRGGALFAPVNLATISEVLLPHSRGTTFRFSIENGKVAPTTIYDTEFAHVSDFTDYADRRRQEWLEWTGDRTDAAAELDDYLTRVKANGTSGKLLLAERVVLQATAREHVDFLLTMHTHVENSALPADARQAQQAKLGRAINAVVNDPASWGPRFLYVLEGNGTQVALGMSYWIEYMNTQENTSNRQLSAYRAQPVRSDRRAATVAPTLAPLFEAGAVDDTAPRGRA